MKDWWIMLHIPAEMLAILWVVKLVENNEKQRQR